jgi:hypothetical protein
MMRLIGFLLFESYSGHYWPWPIMKAASQPMHRAITLLLTKNGGHLPNRGTPNHSLTLASCMRLARAFPKTIPRP